MVDSVTESEPKPPEEGPSAEDPFEVSIQAIRQRTKDVVSALLNPTKIFLSDAGLSRDWHGLAQLVGIGGERIPSLQCGRDATNQIFSLWYQYDQDGATVKKLLQYLEQIDRYDIVDDVTPLLEEDVKTYERNKSLVPLKIEFDSDNYILTRDDVERVGEGLEPQIYDAFVLFAEDDIAFATELIDMLENQFKLKLCVKERDLVVGVFEHDSVIRLIAERCNRLVAIISPSFLDSSSNKFFCSFAQSLGIDQRRRKIVPCMYQPCKVPPELSCYFMLNYQRTGVSNFWERLRDSIRTPTANAAQKHAICRTASQKVTKPQNCLDLLHVESNGLKPKKEIKFNSMINLSDGAILDQSLNPSASANNLTANIATMDNHKKSKLFGGLFKKLIPHKNGKCVNNIMQEAPERHKKSFWTRHTKRKVAVAN